MVVKRIQANYDYLQEVMKQFMRHADMTVALTVQVEGLVDQLQGGAWRGVGAEVFYVEVRDLILPAMRKLEDALQFAGEAAEEAGNWVRANSPSGKICPRLSSPRGRIGAECG